MVSQNLRQAHLLEVGLTKIPRDHETLSIVRHIRLRVDISSMKSCLGLQAFTFVCEANLDSRSVGLRPFDQWELFPMVMGLQSCVWSGPDYEEEVESPACLIRFMTATALAAKVCV